MWQNFLLELVFAFIGCDRSFLYSFAKISFAEGAFLPTVCQVDSRMKTWPWSGLTHMALHAGRWSMPCGLVFGGFRSRLNLGGMHKKLAIVIQNNNSLRVLWKRMNQSKDRGVVTLAEGRKYVAQAEVMAASLREIHPDLPVSLFTSNPADVFRPELFRSIQPSPETVSQDIHLKRFKVLQQRHYEYTLWIDADTFVCGEILAAFDLLDQYDLAAAPAPARPYFRTEFDTEVPEAFFMLNTGVVFYRYTPKIMEGFQLWEEIYIRGKQKTKPSSAYTADQNSARIAFWKSGLRVYVLSQEFNVRARYPVVLKSNARIIHEVTDDLSRLAKIYNAEAGVRSFPKLWKI